MNPAEIEQASRLSWPALEEIAIPEGVLRYAAGVSRRSNSLNLCQQKVWEVERLVSRAQEFFAARNVPAIVKIQDSSICSELDRHLANRGYLNEAPTHVFCSSLFSEVQAVLKTGYQFCSVDLSQWLVDWYSVKEMPAGDLPIHLLMLNKITHPTHYLVARDEYGQAVATAMAVSTGASLAILGVATHVDYRQQGIAESLVGTLMMWGRELGAGYAHLQVEAGNFAALQLYRKLGFSRLYSYWYRVQQPRFVDVV